MATKSGITLTKKEFKQQKAEEIAGVLKSVLPKLKKIAGKKKFETKMKKVIKVLVAGVKPIVSSPKPSPRQKKVK